MVSRFCTICAICTKGGIIMQPTEKLNQANLAIWAQIISEQKPSSLTIRDWCLQNNISYHAYNYWKHKLKESYIDSVLPDIVPIVNQAPSPLLRESRDSNETGKTLNSISITADGIRIEVDSSISDQRLISLIKAVRYA